MAVLTAACSAPVAATALTTPPGSGAGNHCRPVPTTFAASVAPASGARQPFAPGAIGTIASVGADSVTVNTLQGAPVTVNLAQTTAIQMDVKGAVSDLQTGQFLTVAGSTDASGNVSATSVMIRSQLPGAPRTPPTGTSFPTGTRPANGQRHRRGFCRPRNVRDAGNDQWKYSDAQRRPGTGDSDYRRQYFDPEDDYGHYRRS